LPNPAQDQVLVHAEQLPKQPWSIQLFDAAGQLRLHQECAANQPCRIVLKTLEAGVYPVRVVHEGAVETHRLVHLLN